MFVFLFTQEFRAVYFYKREEFDHLHFSYIKVSSSNLIFNFIKIMQWIKLEQEFILNDNIQLTLNFENEEGYDREYNRLANRYNNI